MYASASSRRLDLKNTAARYLRLMAFWCLVLGWAEGLQAGTFEYYEYEVMNGSITITGYTDNAVDDIPVIPAYIEGLPVTAIGSNAFAGSDFNFIIIPNSVTSIGNYAFASCYNLVNVIVPNSVTDIGDYAFENCVHLINATIGSSVTSIGDAPFKGCDSLTAIHVAAGSSNFASSAGVLFDKALHTLVQAPGALSGAYTIPSSVTTIGDYAFSHCWRLNGVSIPNSVTSIGKAAFYDTGLTNLIIGNSVTSIGDLAFWRCYKLSIISIPNSVISIGKGAFYGCTSLTDVTIPNSVTSIGDEAFYRCTGLTNVTISNSVTSIDAWVFFECTGLINVTIPSVISIGDGAFAGCSGLTGIIIPDSVTSIGDNAFAGCTGLTNLVVGNNVTSIGAFSFDTCTGLTSVTIPDRVITISEVAFRYCTALTNVTIGNSTSTIGFGAFSECPSLVSINVATENPNFTSLAGVLFDKSLRTLVHAPGALSGAYTIPSSVTSIGNGAFYYCTRLTSITIPSSVDWIGDSAFYGCGSLVNATFLGDAPTLSGYPLGGVAANFTIDYSSTATGFTTPLWMGYPAQPFDSRSSQTITFPALPNRTWGDAPFTLDATSSSGLPVTVEVVSGPATLSGSTLTLTGAGTVIVRASQSGNDTYAAAAVDQSFTVEKASASVTLGNLTATYNGSPKAATAQTLPSSLPVTLTYAGSATAPTAAGSYAVVGTINHANYQGSASGTLVISKASQTITFAALGTKIYGSTPIVLAATASSGLPVTYTKVSGPATLSGNKLTLTGAGTVVVRASQAGNTSYSAAPSVDRSITSIKSPSATKVTLGGLSTTYNGSTKTITATTSPSGLGVKITYNGSTTVPKNAGSYAIVATVTDPNYKGTTAKATGTLVIKKASQTVTFAGPGNRIYTATPIPLAATASSGLPVTFSVVSGPAKISGTELTLTGLGTVKLRASQAGNSNYASASLDRTITVGKSAEMVYLSKGRLYTQSSATSVKLADSEALPYSFWADVDAGSGSKVRATSAKLTPAPRITLPGTSTFKTATGQTPALGLGEDDDSGWNFGYVGQDYFDNWESPTKSQIDAYFPPGDYVFSIQGKRFALKLPPDSYPQAPVITLSGGSWSGGVYRIRANKTLTIGTGTYSAYGTHVNDGISLGMHDQTTGNSVFDYSHSAKSISYFGLPVSSAKSYTRTIAANTLKAGHRYEVDGVFIAAFTQGTPLPGCTSLVTYETSTEVFIEVINP